MGNYELLHPWFLLLLLTLPFMWWWKYRKSEKPFSRMVLPHIGSIDNLSSVRSILLTFLPVLKYLGLICLIIALARPRLTLKEVEEKAEGIDIMLSLDLSSSMLAQDFNPDRLSASKRMAKKFIDKRKHDRIGLVVFAGESYTQSPLTTDHRILKELIGTIESGILENGTAIGMGLASAVNRLKESESESKVIILLTDGVNNGGYIKPMTAAEIAKEIGVKVYTIGVGSMGYAKMPVQSIFGVQYRNVEVEIDEELLKEISKLTGGKYFRATDENNLLRIYDEIDRLEKTEIDVSIFRKYSEEFRFFLIIGFILILIEWLLKNTFLRTLP